MFQKDRRKPVIKYVYVSNTPITRNEAMSTEVHAEFHNVTRRSAKSMYQVKHARESAEWGMRS